MRRGTPASTSATISSIREIGGPMDAWIKQDGCAQFTGSRSEVHQNGIGANGMGQLRQRFREEVRRTLMREEVTRLDSQRPEPHRVPRCGQRNNTTQFLVCEEFPRECDYPARFASG